MRVGLKIFTGNSNLNLAAAITRYMVYRSAPPLSVPSATGNTVEFRENVRGMDVFVIQSTCQPVNDNIMELLVMVDALKRRLQAE